MTVSFSFYPDPRCACQLDERMRFRLADSLEHIAERSQGIISFDKGALARLIAELRGHYRFSPLLFAMYYDLVDAILEDHLPEAEAIIVDLCQQHPVNGTLTITSLDPALMGASAVDRYCRMMDTDEITRFQYAPPPPQLARDFTKQCEDALALMARAAPELSGEFRNLVHEIVLATGQSTDGAMDFAGASSFLLRGALFINPRGELSPLSLVETLAHELAHSLLFGLMIEESYVLNPDWERFRSPLRDDPRPIDGIYHATFVVARMHYAVQRLLGSGLLDATSSEAAKMALQNHRQAFADGLATIERHGKLTKHGAAIMSSTAHYMKEAALPLRSSALTSRWTA